MAPLLDSRFHGNDKIGVPIEVLLSNPLIVTAEDGVPDLFLDKSDAMLGFIEKRRFSDYCILASGSENTVYTPFFSVEAKP